MKIKLKENIDTDIIISEPSLQFEISDALDSGKKLEDIIRYIEKENPGWKFNRTEPRYDSCIMAIFEHTV